MDDDQIGSLRDFVSAAYHYLTAPKREAAARRVELCEAVGSLLHALEGPLPDDDPDDGEAAPTPGDDEPEPVLRALARLVDEKQVGAKVIPLHSHRRRARRPKGDHR